MLNSESPNHLHVVARLAAGAMLGVCAAFLFGLAGRWWWAADLFSHFRVQYAALLTICALALLFARRYRLAIVASVAAALMAATVVWYAGSASSSANTDAADLRFITFNKYWRNQDTARIGNYLESSNADVIALQEMESPQAIQELARRLPSYPHSYVTADAPLRGVMFSRWPISTAETIELVPRGARVMKVTIDWHGQAVTVVGVHLHWPVGSDNVRLRNAELRQLSRLAQQTQEPLLIGGDFNVTVWSENFREVLRDPRLHDCGKGQGLTTSWPTQFLPAAIGIDHCLCSSHWRVLGVRRGPALGSDHYPVVNDLELNL